MFTGELQYKDYLFPTFVKPLFIESFNSFQASGIQFLVGFPGYKGFQGSEGAEGLLNPSGPLSDWA